MPVLCQLTMCGISTSGEILGSMSFYSESPRIIYYAKSFMFPKALWFLTIDRKENPRHHGRPLFTIKVLCLPLTRKPESIVSSNLRRQGIPLAEPPDRDAVTTYQQHVYLTSRVIMTLSLISQPLFFLRR